MQFHTVESLQRHTGSYAALFQQYSSLRAAQWPQFFTANTPDKYDLYPKTQFYYLVGSDGRLAAGARLIMRPPGSDLKLLFQDKSPYDLQTGHKPGLVDHLNVDQITFAEMSALVVDPRLRHTGQHAGGKMQEFWFAAMKHSPNCPDILIGRVLDANINGLTRAATSQGFDAIIRTDRISTNKGYNVTTFLATCKDLELAPREMFKNGHAIEAAKYVEKQCLHNEGLFI